MPRLSDLTRQQPEAATPEQPRRVRLSEVQAQAEAPQPSLFRADSPFVEQAQLAGPGVLGQLRAASTMLGAAAVDMFGSRRSAADFLASRTGGTVEVDENDEPILRLPSGQAFRLNDEGIDSTDAANLAGNAAAFFTPARYAQGFAQSANLGRVGTIAAQGVAAGAADLGIQGAVAAGTAASGAPRYEVDPLRAGLSAAGGAGGELAAPYIGAVFRRAAESLGRGAGARRMAENIVIQQLGIENTTPQQRELIARAAEDVRRGAPVESVIGSPEFGFIYTQGQRMPSGNAVQRAARYDQLALEDTLRSLPEGARLREVQNVNQNALEQGIQRIAARYGEGSARLGVRPSAAPVEGIERAQSVVREQASALRGQVRQAYEAVPSGSFVDVAALRALPQRLTRATADFQVDPELHPQSASALNIIRQRLEGLPEGTRGVSLEAIEQTRRILSRRRQSATDPTDRAAIRTIIGEFDTFVDEAMESALMRGDSSALDAIKRARGLRAEFGRRFEGEESTDNFVRGLIDDVRVEEKTPEQLLEMAFGAGQISKSGAANFVRRLRAASLDDPEVINGMRTAHFLRMVRGANGEALDPARVMNNIIATERNNRSLVSSLYSDEEWAAVRRLAQAISPTVRGNASEAILRRTSGSTERLIRSLSRFPFLNRAIEALQRPIQSAQIDAAIDAPIPRPRPQTSIPSAVGAASASEPSRR